MPRIPLSPSNEEHAELKKLLDEFCYAMSEKLLSKAEDGIRGWQKMKPDVIRHHILRQIDQGVDADPVDIANYAAFLWWVRNHNDPAVRRDRELTELRASLRNSSIIPRIDDGNGGGECVAFLDELLKEAYDLGRNNPVEQ